MSTSKSSEPLSDHPLFRALVLMGGSLAVGCGGVAEGRAPLGADVDSSNSAGAGAPSLGLGGATASIVIPIAGAGAGAAAGADAAAFYRPSCPYERWDCSAVPLENGCLLALKSTAEPLTAGCTCDTSRPTTASECQSNENFVCRQANPLYVDGQPAPNTWDGFLHVQCACVPAPATAWDKCSATCVEAFATSSATTQCHVPSTATCDGGVCTATSDDVLRQDGIMCGCANIALK